jgi:hypothetical protein
MNIFPTVEANPYFTNNSSTIATTTPAATVSIPLRNIFVPGLNIHNDEIARKRRVMPKVNVNQ